MRKGSSVKHFRRTVGKGKILKQYGRDKRIVEWVDMRKSVHIGTRIHMRSHKK